MRFLSLAALATLLMACRDGVRAERSHRRTVRDASGGPWWA